MTFRLFDERSPAKAMSEASTSNERTNMPQMLTAPGLQRKQTINVWSQGGQSTVESMIAAKTISEGIEQTKALYYP